MDQLDCSVPCTLNLVCRSGDGHTLVVWHTTLRQAIERFKVLDEEIRAGAWICVKSTNGFLREQCLAPSDIAAYAQAALETQRGIQKPTAAPSH
jgi:hypothetical protein